MAGTRDRYYRSADHERKEDVARREFQLGIQDRMAFKTIIDCAVSENARTVGSFARLVLVYVQKRDHADDYRPRVRGFFRLDEYDDAINRILAGKTLGG